MPTILVLDDDEDRMATMKTVLAERFGQFEHAVIVRAGLGIEPADPDFIAFGFWIAQPDAREISADFSQRGKILFI